MREYIENAKLTCQNLMKDVRKQYEGDIKSIQFGVVAYRDHPFYQNDDWEFVTSIRQLTTDADAIDFLEKLKARGGGDIPEAVLDGLSDAASKIDWRVISTKFIFHIADAPPHGLQYCGKDVKDDFLTGCPCNIKIENIASIMKEKKIQYQLLKIVHKPEPFIEKMKKKILSLEDCEMINKAVNKMAAIFKEHIQNF